LAHINHVAAIHQIDRSYTRETATSTTGYGSACPGEGTQQENEKEGRLKEAERYISHR
jgi:hypothetical protein